MPVDITSTLLAALRQLESERERVDRQLEAVRRVLDSVAGPVRGGQVARLGRAETP